MIILAASQTTAIIRDRFAKFGDGLSQLHGWRRAGTAFLCGIGATLAMAPYYIGPLLVGGYSVFILLLWGLSAAPHKTPLRSAFFTGWFFGFGYFLSGIYWMGFAFLVRAEDFAWMVPIAIPGFAGFLALFFAIPALLFVFLSMRLKKPNPMSSLTSILLFSGLISGFEYLRGHILSGLPWNLTGQAMVGLPQGAQSASVYGVYGLGLVVLVLASLPALDLMRGSSERQRPLAGIVFSFAGFLILYGGGAARMALAPTDTIKNASLIIVQPNITQKDKINPALAGKNFETLITLSQEATDELSPSGFHYMVWPENAVAWIDEQPFVTQSITQRIPRSVTLITGSIRRDTGNTGVDHYYNTIAILDAKPVENTSAAINERSVDRFYDKHHLVPFGEYLPMKGFLRAVGLSQLAPVEDGFTPGGGPRTMTLGPLKIAPLICYEAIFPGQLYPRQDRPNLMVTSTNDAWFGDGAGPKQHLDQARLRSIETGVPMARSANTGISSLIDPYGRILHAIPLYETGVINAEIPLATGQTVYDRFGDWLWFFMLSCVFAGATYLARRQG